MMRLLALSSLVIGATAVGVPTDAAVYTFAEGAKEEGLGVVGSVLKFMDPTRAGNPKEILRQLGAAPAPAPEGRVLQAMETYGPTSLTPAPSTMTYSPTTETYAPSTALAVVAFSFDVGAPSADEADLIASIPAYQILVANAAGPTVTPDMVTITFELQAAPVTRRLQEEPERRGLQAATLAPAPAGYVWVAIAYISTPNTQADTVFKLLKETTATELIADFNAIKALPVFSAPTIPDPANPSGPPIDNPTYIPELAGQTITEINTVVEDKTPPGPPPASDTLPPTTVAPTMMPTTAAPTTATDLPTAVSDSPTA